MVGRLIGGQKSIAHPTVNQENILHPLFDQVSKDILLEKYFLLAFFVQSLDAMFNYKFNTSGFGKFTYLESPTGEDSEFI